MATLTSTDYAQVFNQVIDEYFYILPRTAFMENTNPGIVFNGGSLINIPIVDVSGMGDMTNYIAPTGQVNTGWEQRQLQYYRGVNLPIGRYEPTLTNDVKNVSNAMNVFMKQHVVPELDRVRIMRSATFALGGGNVVYNSTPTTNILDALMADIATVQNEIGEDEQLYILMPTTLKNALSLDPKITRVLNMRDMQIRDTSLRIEALNDQYLIGCPSRYMFTNFTLLPGTANQFGVASDPLALPVNWIITARQVMDSKAFPRVTKVIDPDSNQEGEFWKIMFSMFYGVWGYDRKQNGILVNINASTATTLYVASVAAGSGATALTVSATSGGAAYTVPDGYSLMYKTGSSAQTVTLGTPLDATWTALPGSQATISATNSQTVTVALVANNTLAPVSYGSATIVTGD